MLVQVVLMCKVRPITYRDNSFQTFRNAFQKSLQLRAVFSSETVMKQRTNVYPRVLRAQWIKNQTALYRLTQSGRHLLLVI